MNTREYQNLVKFQIETKTKWSRMSVLKSCKKAFSRLGETPSKTHVLLMLMRAGKNTSPKIERAKMQSRKSCECRSPHRTFEIEERMRCAGSCDSIYHALMGDNLQTNSGCLPKKRAKQILHPNYGGINRDEKPDDDQTPNTQAYSRTDDENSVTISTQERQSLQGSHSSQSIFRESNPNHQYHFSHPANEKSLEIQGLVHQFSTLLNDSIRIAETAYSVFLLENQIGAL